MGLPIRQDIEREAPGPATVATAPVSRRRSARRRTDRRELERLAAAGRVAVGVAHDLANVLVVVAAEAQFLATDDRLPCDARAAADQLSVAAGRAVGLSRHLVAFGDVGAPVDSCALDVAVSDAMDLAPSLLSAGTAVTWTPGTRDGRVAVVPVEIHQVVLNLLLNARDALEDRASVHRCGTVAVRTMAGPRPGEVMVIVEDDGPGMPEAVRRRAAESGFTTHPGPGRGVGLASVRSIAQRAGGRLELDSAPGRGTRARVIFPVVAGGA